VSSIENYGAGDLLEIEDETGRKSLIPFRDGIADLEDDRIIIDPEFLA
jgi:16S rRNA processing protein RimM